MDHAIPSSTAAVLREAAECAALAAQRADAGDVDLALDLGSRAAIWLDDLRGPEHQVRR